MASEFQSNCLVLHGTMSMSSACSIDGEQQGVHTNNEWHNAFVHVLTAVSFTSQSQTVIRESISVMTCTYKHTTHTHTEVL